MKTTDPSFQHLLKLPKVASSVFLAPGSKVIGDVTIGEESSLWFNSVCRGDVNFIRIGKRTNIQDLSMIHVSHEANPTVIGDDVTVGHGVILHACTVHDFALIGMGSVLLDGVEVGEYSLVGAGTLLVQNTKIPPYSKVLGRPGKVVGKLGPEQIEQLKFSALHYVELAKAYRSSTAVGTTAMPPPNNIKR